MRNNILLLTEGRVDEQDIFSHVFEQYGVKSFPIKKRIIDLAEGQFKEFELSLGNTNVFIIQAPRNRVHDFLKLLEDPNIILEKVFNYEYAFFQKIFLIYDVDHNDCEDISRMYSLFQDETTGMLLLSSPCIEVLADFNKERKEEKYVHLREYKTQINVHHRGLTKQYIREHFNQIMLFFLEKNYEDFKEKNVMEHPRLIIDKINELNERVNLQDKESSYVIYRYFSTVIYVAIASALSLTKEVDNFDIVKSFFLSKAEN